MRILSPLSRSNSLSSLMPALLKDASPYSISMELPGRGS